MAEITVAEVTNKTDVLPGTGVFDVLMASTNLHLTEQYNENRITGAEFATVYLGALQAVLAQSISFTLGKQAADKQAELLIAQTNEVQEKIDEIIAQTAKHYEAIKASQENTIRENLLNNTTRLKLDEEIDLLQSKDAEQILDTIRKDAEHTAKITEMNYDIAIKAQQELNMKEKNGDVVTTYTYYVDGVSGATTTTTVLSEVLGSVLSTTIATGDGESVVALENMLQYAKKALIDAQALGFASDTKQKILKQMNDGLAVALSVAGRGNVPEANQDAAIDALVQELLLNVGSTVTIGGEVIPPTL